MPPVNLRQGHDGYPDQTRVMDVAVDNAVAGEHAALSDIQRAIAVVQIESIIHPQGISTACQNIQALKRCRGWCVALRNGDVTGDVSVVVLAGGGVINAASGQLLDQRGIIAVTGKISQEQIAATDRQQRAFCQASESAAPVSCHSQKVEHVTDLYGKPCLWQHGEHMITRAPARMPTCSA